MEKKYSRLLFVLVIFACDIFSLVAGGVENKTNMSTGYIRNPSRNSEAKRPEASFYNIAGTAFMENGLYAELGNQFVFKEYANDWDGIYYPPLVVHGGKSNDETTVLFYPDADIVYKKDNWAVFANFGVYAGGGHLDYSEGTSATQALFASGAMQQMLLKDNTNAKYMALASNKHSLDVTSITYGGQAGVSYKFFPWLSCAAALRYVHGTQQMQLKSSAFNFIGRYKNKICYDANAYTLSPVFGIHIRAKDIVDFALQYQGFSKLEYEVKNLTGNKEIARNFDIYNGKKFRTDLPAVLNFGIGVQATDSLYISTSFNYYLNTFAHQDSVLTTTDYDNSWEVALGIDYKIFESLGLSAGFNYGKEGTNSSSNSSFNPVLDSITFGGGIEAKIAKPMLLTIAGNYVKYFDCDYYLSGFKTTLSKDLKIVSVGLTYKFF